MGFKAPTYEQLLEMYKEEVRQHLHFSVGMRLMRDERDQAIKERDEAREKALGLWLMADKVGCFVRPSWIWLPWREAKLNGDLVRREDNAGQMDDVNVS